MPIAHSATTRPSAAHARAEKKRQIGPWILTESIGRGAATEVFAAHHVDCEPDSASYAVKLLSAEFRRNPEAIQSLQREAFVLSQVHHPNLAPMLDSQIDAPPFWIATPRLAGQRASLNNGRPFDPPVALWFARQAAGALQALHAKKWLHNDVKPDNMIIAPSGHLTLIDLGFASRVDEKTPQVWRGTLEYSAPETFASSAQATGAADVYSLGVSLYQWLVGATPFTGDEAELMQAHAAKPMPDPRQERPTLHNGIVRLMRGMLSKEPLRRPVITELIERLTELEIETFDQRSEVA